MFVLTSTVRIPQKSDEACNARKTEKEGRMPRTDIGRQLLFSER